MENYLLRSVDMLEPHLHNEHIAPRQRIDREQMGDEVTWTDMTPDQRRATLETMCKFGGDFAQRLGLLMFRADSINAAKLAAAFPELIAKYGPGSGFFAEVAMTQGVRA